MDNPQTIKSTVTRRDLTRRPVFGLGYSTRPRVHFAGIQRDRTGQEVGYMFTDDVHDSTITVPISDPFSLYERLSRCRLAFLLT